MTNKVDDEFLGTWGKHLVNEYGLSAEQASDIEQEGAELYAHKTREGWCCACEADMAFAINYIKDEPEFKDLITQEKTALLERIYQNAKYGEDKIASEVLDRIEVALQQIKEDQTVKS